MVLAICRNKSVNSAVCAFGCPGKLALMLSNFLRLKAIQSSKMAEDAQTADNRACAIEDDAARWADLAQMAEREERLAEGLPEKSEGTQATSPER